MQSSSDYHLAPLPRSEWQSEYTGWTQKHSLISSSYKIKTYWNIFNKYGTADTLTQEIFNFLAAARGLWNARWRSLHSNAADACWNFIKQTVLWLCSLFSNANLMLIRPTNRSILKWHRNFIERGCICDQRKGHSGRPSVSEQLSTWSRRICCRESGPS